MAEHEVPTYTIIQADGLYSDEDFEKQLFAPKPGQNYRVNYLQSYLYPVGAEGPKPWSSIPEDVPNQVDGIEVLKMGFSEKDLQHFPNLKV